MFHLRLRIIQLCLVLAFGLVLTRLFYWQVLAGSKLETLAQVQHQSLETIPADRGSIIAQDGFPLVTNQPIYTLFVYRPDLKIDPTSLSTKLAPLLQPLFPTDTNLQTTLTAKLNESNSTWIPLNRRVPQSIKDKVTALNLEGLGFDTNHIRFYPEGSLSAQLLGFVGADNNGDPKGYFGLEGYYNLELTGRPGFIRQDKDVQGRPILVGDFTSVSSRQGRTLTTHIDRGLQLLIENGLKDGLNQYEASAGEVLVMDPTTGAILALAAFPAYDPGNYNNYPPATYKIPSISDTYEPGSTFKTLVLAAALDAGAIKPDTVCAVECAGPVKIGQYAIRTWNNEYNPGSLPVEILERSDNVGMVFIAQKLGQIALVDYLHQFGFGAVTGIDLEGEASAPLRSRWGDIDVATSSFGQGIAVTSIQMLTAVSAIANGGELYKPQIVSSVKDGDREIPIKPYRVRQVITSNTAQLVTQMMIKSAQHGEAKWLAPAGYTLAGKTGTAQVPVAGYYDTEKTIASFVGFAPATKPRFAMIVKLQEPQRSQWASETAAPLWFNLATRILHYLNIPPDQ